MYNIQATYFRERFNTKIISQIIPSIKQHYENNFQFFLNCNITMRPVHC